MKKILTFMAVIAISMQFGCTPKETEITPGEAREIAKEAFIFSFPMLMSYEIMRIQAINEGEKGYMNSLNTLSHLRFRITDKFRVIVGPNNNTLYSIAWLNLNNEPIVFTTPDMGDRYYVIQLADIFTHNFGYISSNATGQHGGTYLITGPNWDGATPEGIDKVFQSEGNFVFLVPRLYVSSDEEVPVVNALQDQMNLQTLSAFLGTDAPASVTLEFSNYSLNTMKTSEFIGGLNFLLTQLKPHPTEAELYKRFAKLGIEAGKHFDASTIKPEIIEAINLGVADAMEEIGKHAPTMGRKINGWNSFGTAFGSREQMQGRYLDRAAAAMVGIFGNDPEENNTYTAYFDGEGESLDASKHSYTLTYAADQFPPVKGFWSLTMYDMKDYLFVTNPINRFSVWGEDPSLEFAEDGSLTIYFSKDAEGMPEGANWLPAPDGPFGIALRNYWPEEAILDESWIPAPIEKIK